MTTVDKRKGWIRKRVVLRGPLKKLADAVGGRQNLATAIGVKSDWTIVRWSTGESVPWGPTRLALAELAARYGIEPPYPLDRSRERPRWTAEISPRSERAEGQADDHASLG